jgi:SRSO17 transposase
LLGERAARGQPEERKYYWSNLPASATLEELVDIAHRRHAVEQFHEEAKGELGWDQYQGRLWPGFHRHAVSAMLAYSFLLWQELRQLFPLGWIAGVARCLPYIGKSPDGYATKRCCGG